MTQAFNLSQLANNLNSSGQLDATDGLVNAVPVANGGTGVSSLTGIPYASGTSAFTAATASQIKTAIGTLDVPSGGTGVTSISSGALVKGNGTSAFSAASGSDIATAIGTNYVANASYATASGNGGVTSVNAKTGAVQSVITSLTNQTAGGTVVDFSGIPSWAKRITVMITGLSSSGTSDFIVRLGTSGGFVATGYVSQSVYIYANPVVDNITTGLGLTGANVAGESVTGQMIISNQTGSTWTASAMLARSGGIYPQIGMGGVTLGGTLTSVRVTTLNGTDTFDAGTVNVMYE